VDFPFLRSRRLWQGRKLKLGGNETFAAPIAGRIIGMVGAVQANSTAAVITLKINGGSSVGALTLGTTAGQATTIDFINGAGTTITNDSNRVNAGDSIQLACDRNGTNGVAADVTVVIRGAG
jgi:hypothetical protein